jgi:hypothetical protein
MGRLGFFVAKPGQVPQPDRFTSQMPVLSSYGEEQRGQTLANDQNVERISVGPTSHVRSSEGSGHGAVAVSLHFNPSCLPAVGDRS